MTFNELDKRAIEWNNIANGHRTPENRYDVQIDMCNEEMCKEFFYWLGEWNKFNSKHTEKEVKTEILDGFADSRFVFIEFINLQHKIGFYEHTNNYNVKLFRNVKYCSMDVFSYEELIEAYRRVIESNFSKFVKADDYHDAKFAAYESNRMSEEYETLITAELNNGYWVFRDSNGKIRKPSTFKPVDLSDLI